MGLESVWCTVGQKHVSRTTDLEGAVTTVICDDYDPITGACRHRAEIRNNGPLARLLERVSENTLETNLHADCLAGLYAFSGFAGDRGDDQQLFLSAGDLDEAVIGFLRNSDASADVDDRDDRSVGTAFQRFNAYRDGFLEGPDACEALLAGSG